MTLINGKTIIAAIGLLAGLLNGMSRDNYIGISDINDLVELIGFCIPYTAIGLALGWGVDYLKSKLK